MTWISQQGETPWLHVGYDLFVRTRSRRSRVAIVSTGASVEEALQGDPWVKVIHGLTYLAEGHGELPLTWRSPGQ